MAQSQSACVHAFGVKIALKRDVNKSIGTENWTAGLIYRAAKPANATQVNDTMTKATTTTTTTTHISSALLPSDFDFNH